METKDNHIVWNSRTVFTLIICVAIPLIVGALSAFFTKDAMGAFETMNKPPLAPPGWLFPVAWTILYILMGVASFLIIKSNYESRGIVICIYCIQLLFNFAWSLFFFNLEAYVFSAIWLAILVVMILALIVKTARFSIPAMLMFVPYLCWCLFAMYLNVGIAVLNQLYKTGLIEMKEISRRLILFFAIITQEYPQSHS